MGALVRPSLVQLCRISAGAQALRWTPPPCKGLLRGMPLSGVSSLRGALEQLKSAHGFQLIEQDGALVFQMPIGDARGRTASSAHDRRGASPSALFA